MVVAVIDARGRMQVVGSTGVASASGEGGLVAWRSWSILPAQRQLLLQIGDLLLRIRDLLFGVAEFLFAFGQLLFAFGQFRLALGQFRLALGQLVTEILNLLLLPLDLPVQFFAAGLFGVPIAIRRRALSSLPAANPCRTHPPYVKRFGAICPAKSTRVLELLRKQIEGQTGL